MKHLVIKLYSYFIARKVDQWRKNPISHQKKLFQEILTKTKTSQYRKDLQIEDVFDYETFRNRVPLQDFEHLKPYVSKISDGEQNVLSSDPVAYLVMTSGTTSGKKYIPVTKRGMAYYLKGAGDSIFHYIHTYKKSRLFSGKILAITGSPVLDKIGQIYSGRVSSLMNHQHTRLYKWFNTSFRLPSTASNSIPVWSEKVEAVIEETIDEDVRMIIGLPIWIQNYFEGILSRGHKYVLDVFPNLQLFIHGGLSIKPYYKHLIKLLHSSRRIDFVEVYNASEGYYAFQDDIEDDSLLLHLNTGLFYEFIPVREARAGSQLRIPLWEVEAGAEYELIISSISGVLAYRTGDTIRITQTYPFKIVWTGRTQHFTSAFNEHVIAEEVEGAIQYAVEKASVDIIEFTVAPKIELGEQEACYDWYIEFGQELNASKIKAVSEALDEFIRSKNHLYRELRQADILKQPRITSIQKNGFMAYMKEIGKLGDQHKVVHLSNNRAIIEKLSKWTIS